MAAKNAAFIGCGKVSHFHADVLRFLNVDIEGVCGGSPDSISATSFAERHHAGHVYPDYRKLLADSDADYLWVVAPWDVTETLLDALLSDGRPALVEKPLATTSSKLDRILQEVHQFNLYCGMNRRHYDHVESLRRNLSSSSIRFVQTTLSEQTLIYDTSDPQEANRVQNLWLNSSIHELDLLLHLFGNLSVDRVYRRRDESSGWLTSVNAVLTASDGFPVFITANWNSSEAKSILVETTDRTYRLGPIEMMSVCQGLRRSEPTPESPIATYGPNVIERIDTDRTFKPGFLNQTREFLDVADSGSLDAVSRASVKDAHRVTCLIEELLHEADDV